MPPTVEKAKQEPCPTCGTIPDSSRGFWKGGELQSGGISAAESKLEVNGAPFYDDNTSYRHSCVKRCLKCGTYFLWEFDYEYLVNGTEDEITLTRLSNVEAEKRVKEVFDTIKTAENSFRAKIPTHLDALKKSSDAKAVYAAADFLSSGQSKGFDVSFAIPCLAHALAKHLHQKSGYCPGNTMLVVLYGYASNNKDHSKELLQLIESEEISTEGLEVRDLINYVKQQIEKNQKQF